MRMKYSSLLFLPIVGCVADATSHDDPPTHVDQAADIDGKAERLPNSSRGRGVLIVQPDGHLRLLDADSGDPIDELHANAIDAFASETSAGAAWITEWNEEGGGAVVTLAIDSRGIRRTEATPLSTDDARILHAPDPFAGLAIGEGTTLFDGGEGRAVFNTSSAWVDRSASPLELYLLERASSQPRLGRFRFSPDVSEVSDEPTSTLPFACAPRLIRDGYEPLLAGVFHGAIVVQQPSGRLRHWSARAAAPGACVQDAIALHRNEVAVVTGPAARVHVLSVDGQSSEHLVFAGQLSHDPNPRRRLAFDPSRSRLWIAAPNGVHARRVSSPGETHAEITSGVRAESVAMVWW